ncbi:MAG TPA: SgcJ/EcaC family oxidoreductase [Thermoanaerobaculia bacterium]
MKRTLLSAVLLSLFALPLSAQKITGVAEADVRAIAAMVAESDVRWNNRDAAGLSNLFTADVNIRINTNDIAGRDNVRAFFTNSLGRVPAGMRHRTEIKELQLLAPDVVWGEAHVWLEDETKVVREFKVMSVLKKENGEWKIRVNRATAL